MMKVLSIKEPWATLISKKIKIIETRSWKTNYRGKLYIHASITPMDKKTKENKDVQKIIENNNIDFNRGYILCSCNLIDCIYMTEEYIEKVKKDNYINYLCGNYQVGRYAWVLDNIKILKNPIAAKGKLGIWNFDENGVDLSVKNNRSK